MRILAITALVALVFPFDAGAQFAPRPGSILGDFTPPLGREPDVIARYQEYRRINLSVETYPLVSYVRSPGFAGPGTTSSWISLGTGVRVEYRNTPYLSTTLDITSSLVGGPANLATAELGARFRQARSERRVYPFFDVRAGYIAALHGDLASSGFNYGSSSYGYSSSGVTSGSRYSTGFGGVAGAGVEYDLTRRFTITTSASLMHTRLTAHDFAAGTPADPNFALTALRYTVGLQYTPVRSVRADRQRAR